jgi:hypothetical protein
MSRQVLLNSIDITRYTISIGKIEERLHLPGEIANTPIGKVVVSGVNSSFDWLSTINFSDTNLRPSIKIIESGTLTFDGYVDSFTSNLDSHTLELSIVNKLFYLMNNVLTYESAYNMSPAQVLQEIFQLYNIPYDHSNFSMWAGFYETMSDPFEIYVSSLSTRTMSEVVEDVCNVGCASLYFSEGKFGMYVYYNELERISIGDILRKDIYAAVSVTQPRREVTQGVSVAYVDGVYSEGNFDNVAQITADLSSEVQILNLQTAVLCTSRWLNYMNTLSIHTGFKIRNEIAQSMRLGMVFNIENIGLCTLCAITRGDLLTSDVEFVSVPDVTIQ